MATYPLHSRGHIQKGVWIVAVYSLVLGHTQKG